MSDAERSQRAYARFAGLMCLAVLALSLAGLVLASVVAGARDGVLAPHQGNQDGKPGPGPDWSPLGA